MGTLAVRLAVACACLAAAPGSALAAIPYESPTTVRDRLGIERTEQSMRVELSPGTGRALLYLDHGAGGGHIDPKVVVRRADGSWSVPVPVPEDARFGGNAADDVVVAGTASTGVQVRVLPRAVDALGSPETLAGLRLLGAPGLADDGTVALVALDGEDQTTLQRRAPDGSWAALPLDLAAAVPDRTFAVLRAQPEPDGSTRLVVLGFVIPGERQVQWDLVHLRVLPDGSLTDVDRLELALGEMAAFYLLRGVAPRVPSVIAPGGAALVVVPDGAGAARGGRPGGSASALRVRAFTRAATGGWTASIVTSQRLAAVSRAIQHFGAGAALDADGTAAVVYGLPVVSAFVRPAGASSWGKAIPLETMDTYTGDNPIAGVALAGGQLRAAWGAHPFLIPRVGSNQWRVVERSLVADAASAAGGQWPTRLTALGPVRIVRTAPFANRVETTIRLARGPSVVYFVLNRCAPRCGAPGNPDHAMHARVGSNAVTFRTEGLQPGRWRLRVFVPGPPNVLQRFVTVR